MMIQNLYILHCITFLGSVVEIGMERSNYTVMENVGDDDLCLSVCAIVEDSGFAFEAVIVPLNGLAEGEYNQKVMLPCKLFKPNKKYLCF